MVETDRRSLCEIKSWLSNSSGLLIIKFVQVLLLGNISNGISVQKYCLFTLLFEI